MDATKANLKLLKAISEREWQATVCAHAATAGWLCYFIPDGMWRRSFANHIPQSLGDRGFPDLVLVSRDGRVLFRELKKIGGTLSKYQIEWRDRLLAGGNDWDLWTPLDLDRIIAILYQ